MTRAERDSDEGYMEFQLDGRQMLIVMAGILLLCAISFYFGKRVGRAEAAGEAGVMGPMVMTGEEPLDTEPASRDLTFFDTVGERPRPATPPPVAAGTAARTPRTGSSSDLAAAAHPAPSTAQPPVQTPVAQLQDEAPPRAPAAVTSGGIAIQVAVLSTRAAADDLARRLQDKGYRSVVSTHPSKGFRVRVVGYADRAAAETAAARLKREEKLEPWIPPQGS